MQPVGGEAAPTGLEVNRVAVPGRHRDVVRDRQIELQPRRRGDQARQARRQPFDPEDPERPARREGAGRRGLTQRRRHPHRARGLALVAPCPVEDSRHDRAQPAAGRQVDRPLGQPRRPPVQPHQRQAQEQLRQRQLGLDPVGDRLFDAVEGQVGPLLAERLDVVAERRPRLAKLDEVLPRAGEQLSAREAHRLRHDVALLRRRRQDHDRLAGPGAAARVDDAKPRLQIVEALLGGEQPQERDQSIDGREARHELPPDHDPARVDAEARQVEPSLPERDPLQHAAILPGQACRGGC